MPPNQHLPLARCLLPISEPSTTRVVVLIWCAGTLPSTGEHPLTTNSVMNKQKAVSKQVFLSSSKSLRVYFEIDCIKHIFVFFLPFFLYFVSLYQIIWSEVENQIPVRMKLKAKRMTFLSPHPLIFAYT